MSIFGRQNRLVTTSKTFSGTSLDITKTINAPYKSLVLTGRYTQATPSITNPKYPSFSGNCKLYAGNNEVNVPVLKASLGGADTYDVITGTNTSNITELICTGNENWMRLQAFGATLGNTRNIILFRFNVNAKVGYNIGGSSHFETATSTDDIGYNTNRRYGQQATNLVYIKVLATDLGITTSATDTEAVTAFKAWLIAENTKGTPLTLYIVKSTPTTTKLTPVIPQSTQHLTRVYDNGILACDKNAEVLVYGR